MGRSALLSRRIQKVVFIAFLTILGGFLWIEVLHWSASITQPPKPKVQPSVTVQSHDTIESIVADTGEVGFSSAAHARSEREDISAAQIALQREGLANQSGSQNQPVRRWNHQQGFGGAISVTIMVYLTHKEDPQQVERISDLLEMFGDDLFVIWGGVDKVGQDLVDLQHLFGTKNIILNQKISQTHWLAVPCCGTEMTIHWLLDNRHRYSFAWVVEGSDVLYSSKNWFLEMLQSSQNLKHDLLHQTPGMERMPLWEWKAWHNRALINTRKTLPEARFYKPYYKSMYNLFRVSPHMLDELERWYISNNRRWVFFEPLFSTLSAQSRTITTTSWMTKQFPGIFRFRPCFSEDEIKRKSNQLFYHPVKAGFEDCAFHKLPVW